MLFGALGRAGTGTAVYAIEHREAVAEKEFRSDLERAEATAILTESMMAVNGFTPQMTQGLHIKQKQVISKTQAAFLGQPVGKGAAAAVGGGFYLSEILPPALSDGCW